MDCAKVGGLICRLRKEKGLTQKQLADTLHLSNKTVSKWETGSGCPDVSLLPQLSALLNVDIEKILLGELPENEFVGGNMKKTKYTVCPTCGNLVVSTGEAEVSCCGRRLETLVPQKADGDDRLTVEVVEDDWFITSDHPMLKEHSISFVAFATGDRVQIIKQYPEWNLQVRIPKRGHGLLLWYCTQHGLFYQLL